MAIYRHTHETCFTVLPNALIRDSALSLRDVGLLAYLLSLPEDWQFSISGMAAVLEKDGRDSVRTCLHSLEAQGYLRRFQPRGENGKLKDMVWDITDIPGVFSTSPVAEKPLTDKPLTVEPHTDEPYTGNPIQTKKQSNKETNNKETTKQTQVRKEYLSQEHGETDLPYIWKSGYEM